MNLKKPKFWDYKKPNAFAYLLLPISFLIRLIKLLKKNTKIKSSKIKTICVGNIYLGGTGKTSLSIKINEILSEKKIRSCFIKKFYLNQLDEQKLLESRGKLFTSSKRGDAIILAEKNNYQFAICDDGLQDDTINYDLKFVCFNNLNWIGNGLTIPAGPLRESIKSGLSRTNLIIVIGNVTDYLNETIPDHIPIISAKFTINNEHKIFKGQKIIAFAGIAYPQKFFDSLREQGAKIVKEITFPDHHIFDENDLLSLAETANKNQSILVSTQKDFVRIPKSYRTLVNTLDGEINFKNEDLLKEILTNVIENHIQDEN